MSLSKILAATVQLQSADGDHAGAWDTALTSLRLANVLEDEPLLISQLVRTANINVAIESIRSLDYAVAPPSHLHRRKDRQYFREILQCLRFRAFLVPVMAHPRLLAPWHQPDLIAALEDEGLSVAELAALKGKPAIYHAISRVVGRDFVLGDAEREQFVAYMRSYEHFCGLRVLAFCVMSNHFHILLEVPSPPEERGADWSDEKLLDHLAELYSKQQMGKLRWELEHYRAQNNTEAAESFRERYFRRMWDLSQFMKPLKQRFTSWFNRKHSRKGTLWEERFKSVLVEDGHAARTMAAYIDLNPVRANMVDDPKDYRWCSYGEAMAGKKRSREGLQRVMFEAGAAVMAEEIAVEELISWRKAVYHYRQILYMAVNRDDPNLNPGDAPQLTEADALLCRARELIDGMALGTGPFIENIFGWCRELFSEKRKSGARKLKGIKTSLRTLRDLKVDPPPG